MVDDLDYPDFEFNEVNNTGGRNYSIQIMFVLFMISMSILIMNLLVTVAVNNTENLAERSELMLSRRKTSFLEEFTSYKKKIIVKQLFDILEMCKKIILYEYYHISFHPTLKVKIIEKMPFLTRF